MVDARRRERTGQAVGLTADAGYFTLFDASNVEMLVKVVDGCGFNRRFWTFAGGLTDVNVVMTVTDTQTGAVKNYTNPQGTPFQPIQDTDGIPGTAAPTGRLVPGRNLPRPRQLRFLLPLFRGQRTAAMSASRTRRRCA